MFPSSIASVSETKAEMKAIDPIIVVLREPLDIFIEISFSFESPIINFLRSVKYESYKVMGILSSEIFLP